MLRACNPCIQEAEEEHHSSTEARLGYMVSFKSAWAVESDPVSKHVTGNTHINLKILSWFLLSVDLFKMNVHFKKTNQATFVDDTLLCLLVIL